VPVAKTWTAGLQVVNGWNNVVDNNGGVTIGLTSVLTKPKYAWAVNYYTGAGEREYAEGLPQSLRHHGHAYSHEQIKRLCELRLRAKPKFRPRSALARGVSVITPEPNRRTGREWPLPHADRSLQSPHWSAASSTSMTIRDFSTGTTQALKEFTATYEYKWLEGLLTRAEYRRDWS